MNKASILKKIIQLCNARLRHLLYLLWCFYSSRKPVPDTELVIDVMIPVIESDLPLLPLCIEGVRKNVKHVIKDIYIVAPCNENIKKIAAELQLRFVNENSLFEYAPADINYKIFTGLNRSGWIFQQLVKLSGRAGTCRHYLVIDADHILLQPHVFYTHQKQTVFYQSREYNLPYYINFKKLLGFFPLSFFSYVSHKMLFDKEELKKLHRKIEAVNGGKMSWDRVIIESLDVNNVSDFSEFELYGNFIDADQKLRIPWKEKPLGKSQVASYDTLHGLYSKKYRSVSFPAFLHNQ